MAVIDAPAPTTPTRRLHDLDALRGFAMLLGILLHTLLAFFPTFWPVQDRTSGIGGPYDEIFHFIHGFRMPLFFLLSGFFTAMLWRRRGLNSLLIHRLKRIALPLAVGVITIVPAVNWASGYGIETGIAEYVEETGDIFTPVFLDQLGGVEVALDAGVDPDIREPGQGFRPLHAAAIMNNPDIAIALIEAGAEPDATDFQGDTALGYAFFFGHDEVADALVAGGAFDFRQPGQDWEDIEGWGFGESQKAELGLEETGLETWLASFHHLWFLWFLLWLVAGFAVVAMAVGRFGRNTEPRAWVTRVMWGLVPLALLPQLLMGNGGESAGFGPDTSTGLLPLPHVLGYYALFFAFGALAYGRPTSSGEPLIERLGQRWWVILPVTLLVVFPLGLRWTFVEEDAWFLASIAQVVFAWALSIGLIGVFRALLSTERRGVRYLSDSSYWLYLAHVPLVILVQAFVSDWNLPSFVKLTGITIGVTLLLLVTYQLFIRYTPIGTMLNGTRTRPAQADG